VPAFSGGSPLHVLGMSILPQEVWLIGALLAMMLASAWFFQRTMLGLACAPARRTRLARPTWASTRPPWVWSPSRWPASSAASAAPSGARFTSPRWMWGWVGAERFTAAVIGGMSTAGDRSRAASRWPCWRLHRRLHLLLVAGRGAVRVMLVMLLVRPRGCWAGQSLPARRIRSRPPRPASAPSSCPAANWACSAAAWRCSRWCRCCSRCRCWQRHLRADHDHRRDRPGADHGYGGQLALGRARS